MRKCYDGSVRQLDMRKWKKFFVEIKSVAERIGTSVEDRIGTSVEDRIGTSIADRIGTSIADRIGTRWYETHCIERVRIASSTNCRFTYYIHKPQKCR
jgi:hypothetical protein